MSFLFVNLFDTTGTLVGVATRANLIDDNAESKVLITPSKLIVVQAYSAHFLVVPL